MFMHLTMVIITHMQIDCYCLVKWSLKLLQKELRHTEMYTYQRYRNI